MKLHVLGSSSKGNGYILEGNDQALLIECGLPSIEMKKALNFNISKIVGVIVSHRHGDHAGFVLDYARLGVPTHMLEDVFVYMSSLKSSIVENWFIHPGKQFNVGNFTVLPFEVNHDVPCVGFLINHPESGTILFATDTRYLPKRFKGLSNIMIECNYEEGIMANNVWNGEVHSFRAERTRNSHMSLETCIAALKSNDLKAVQNIVLIHLSPQNSDAEMFRQRVVEATGKPVFIAKKDLVIDFNKNPF